jgi:hypothetical protein
MIVEIDYDLVAFAPEDRRHCQIITACLRQQPCMRPGFHLSESLTAPNLTQINRNGGEGARAGRDPRLAWLITSFVVKNDSPLCTERSHP